MPLKAALCCTERRSPCTPCSPRHCSRAVLCLGQAVVSHMHMVNPSSWAQLSLIALMGAAQPQCPLSVVLGADLPGCQGVVEPPQQQRSSLALPCRSSHAAEETLCSMQTSDDVFAVARLPWCAGG